jgi:D-galactarolactone isomerase
VPDAEIARLHAGGMRGVRYMMIGGVLTWASLEPMAARLANADWMVNLQLDGRTMPAHEAVLKRLPCRLVLDHNGKFLEPVAPSDPSFQALLRVLDSGRVWIKLSAPYETSKVGAPGYDDVSLLARTLAETFPERCLWASNWPHPGRDPRPGARRCTTCCSTGRPATPRAGASWWTTRRRCTGSSQPRAPGAGSAGREAAHNRRFPFF